ncbi:aldose 1-epimerase family protein [Kribbella deserti]|uniref:Aldose 1-epimerase family protein n=1 Tax=Kribbella deserti TaxID=1926257 RepID=A0ABV6QQI7_9ACTN
MTSPSGRQWTISSGEYTATIVEVGGGVRSLTRDGTDVLIGYGENESAHAGIGQQLLPWPNRIADGRYTFEGTDEQLSLTEPDKHNAIHGLTRWASWSRLDDGSSEAVCVVGYRLYGEPGYRHQLDFSIRYEVSAEGLAVEATATNIGTTNAPYGFGTHPYLTVGRRLDECELSFTAGKRVDVDPDRLLPRGVEDVAGTPFDFSTGRVVGDLFIDNAFTDLPDEWTVRLTDPSSDRSVALTSDTRWLQLYSANAIDRAGVAVEPMTCPPNAFVTGEDVIVLAPGDRHSTSYRVA